MAHNPSDGPLRRRLNPDEVLGLIARGREHRDCEFKGPGKRVDKDKTHLGKVVRAILAMANTQDGGFVILGVEDGEPPKVVGLAPEELETWRYDDLAASVSTYADPFVEFDAYPVDLSGQSVVVIRVEWFRDLPVICKRALNNDLRDGALYVRTKRGKIESAAVSSHVEMRELLDHAAEKRARDMVALMARIAPSAGSTTPARPHAAYDDELEDLMR